MTITRRQRWLIVAAVACVGLLVADRILLTPLAAAWHGHTARMEKLRAELSRSRTLVTQAHTWLEALRDYRRRALPTDRSAAESLVVRSVREWGEASGLVITSMRPSWKEQRGEPVLLEIHLTAAGDLRAVARFLHAVETADLPLRTGALAVVSSSSDPRALTLTMDIESVLIDGGPDRAPDGGAS